MVGISASRMGVGVDQTAFDRRLDGWTAILDERELEERKPRRVMVSGIDVYLYRAGENLHALANRCTHRGGPLHKGSTDEHTVTCPWHLSMFRLEDGSVLRGPATAPQPSYEARVRDGAIEIRSTPIAKTSR